MKTMENLMESSKKLLDEDHTKGLLMKAADVAPLVQKQEAVADRYSYCLFVCLFVHSFVGLFVLSWFFNIVLAMTR